MSDREGDRPKFYGKKKYNAHRNDQKLFGKNHRLFKGDKEYDDKSKVKQPQILIKAREKIEDSSLSSPKHPNKDKEELPTGPKEAPANINNDIPHVALPTQLFHNAKRMHKAVKLLDDGILYNDNLQDFMNETSDFLVVGIVGSQGVGKSTIMNILSAETHPSREKKNGDRVQNQADTKHVFKQQTLNDHESCSHVTNGIDIFITENRMILLDCQPFLSPSVIEDLIHTEVKRSAVYGDYTLGELHGLQQIAFIMSVCHVVIFAQDFILDSNHLRFFLTAETLKPTISNNEEEFIDHIPHLVLLHNKAKFDDFQPIRFKKLQQAYHQIFKNSKLHFETCLGLGNGKLIPALNEANCGPPLNLFLIPDFEVYDESIYQGFPSIKKITQTLRRNICSVTKFPLSHVTLTEKTWLSYCTKAWDHIKKSSFYVEYSKVLP